MNLVLLWLLVLLAVGHTGVSAQSAITTEINGGNVTINPSKLKPLRRVGRFFFRGTKPYYVAGVGGPEGFAFLTDTRKQSIINSLKARFVNGIYFHALRAFGGDGGPDEHLFFSSDDKRLDPAKLSALAFYMDQLDQAGIVMWFHALDDHAKPWGCINDTNAADYAAYASDLARVFGGYKHLIWVTQEEYNWLTAQSGCEADANVRLQNTLAEALRGNDAIHAIATHHMNGQQFAFGGNAFITVFGQQTYVKSIEDMHEVSGLQGWSSGAPYVMAEAYPWHGDLLMSGDVQTMRRSLWATAFSGGSVFVWGPYELKTPSTSLLNAIDRVKKFMNAVQYHLTVPLFGTDLAARIAGGTKWIMCNDDRGVYLLYGADSASLGVTGVAAGTFSARWYDAISGAFVDGGTITHPGDSLVLDKPTTIGVEAALYLVRLTTA